MAGMLIGEIEPAGWVALLYACGLALMFLEVFIPGWIAGTAGAACLILSIALAWRSLSPALAVALAAGAAAGVPAVFFLGIRRLALRKELSERAGFVPPGGIPDPQRLLGSRGVAATILRPSGAVDLAGRRFDARAEQGYIESGASVEVVRVDRNELVVRPVN